MTTPRYATIARFPGYRIGDDGSVWSNKSGEWVKLKTALGKRHGYPVVEFSLGKKGRRKLLLVHRLVMEAFVGPCPPGEEVRHFPNRDKTDIRLANLRYGTKSQNQQDSVFHGTRNDEAKGSKGVTNPAAKLDDFKVRKMRALFDSGDYGIRPLSRKFGVSRDVVRRVVTRKGWKHVT